MGTRSTVTIKDDAETIVKIYRQYDGYPTGMGNDLKGLLEHTKIVNGYSSGDQLPHAANRMGCLAAYVIRELKENIGNVYIVSPNHGHEGYNYTISNYKDSIQLKVTNYELRTLYDGDIRDFDAKKVEQFENTLYND